MSVRKHFKNYCKTYYYYIVIFGENIQTRHIPNLHLIKTLELMSIERFNPTPSPWYSINNDLEQKLRGTFSWERVSPVTAVLIASSKVSTDITLTDIHILHLPSLLKIISFSNLQMRMKI